MNIQLNNNLEVTISNDKKTFTDNGGWDFNPKTNKWFVIISYDKQTFTNFKKIEGCIYNPITNHWSFPYESLAQVNAVLGQHVNSTSDIVCDLINCFSRL